jgi:hypothetical protein
MSRSDSTALHVTRRATLAALALLLGAAGSAAATRATSRATLPAVPPALAAAPAPAVAPAATQLIGKMWVFAPGSWAYPIVPRMTADADSAGPLAPSAGLFSGQVTYFNWCTEKNEAICGVWTDELDLDGVAVDRQSHTSCAWQRIFFPNLNQTPIPVRGGRHELVVRPDIYEQVATDYSFYPQPWGRQFVWSPMPLPEGSLIGGFTPPPVGYWSYPNSDGYQMQRANPWAWVVAEIATAPAADCDLLVYSDPWQGGDTGFSVEAARSTQGAGQLDFVVGTTSSTNASLFPAVMRGSAGDAGGYYLNWTDSDGQRDTTGDHAWIGSVGSGRFAQVYEAWLTAGVNVGIDLTRLSGSDDITADVFAPTPGTVWKRGQTIATMFQQANPNVDAMRFTPSQTGWHPIVVYLTQNAASSIGESYELRVGPSGVLDAEIVRTPLFLADAAPNPALDRTRFAFGLPTSQHVRLALYDVTGRRVRTVVEGSLDAGRHDATWDLRDDSGARIGAGVYWARFEAGGKSLTRRVAVVR